MANSISEWVKAHKNEAIELLQDLIRIPSPSGREKECGERVAEAMRKAGFNSTKVDNLSNAMGVVEGEGDGRSLLLNGHIDHVPPGDMVDPYSGRLMNGSPFDVEGDVIYGRASSDMKAAVAAMVMSGACIIDLGIQLKGDFKVAAVTQEEIGGAGTKSTIENDLFLADVVLIGEATQMDLALGHRGSMKASIVVKGRSCHASAPERGINALYKAQDLMARIRNELIPKLPSDTLYGRTSMAITQIEVKPGTLNVVPEECRFFIDCRNTPNYPVEKLRDDLMILIKSQNDKDPEFRATVIPTSLLSGHRSFTGFYTDPEHYPIVFEAEETMRNVLGRAPKRKTWTFATDGRFYSWLGLPVIGFGPGEERFAHTNLDHVRIDDYLKTIEVYTALAEEICSSRTASS